MLSAVFQSKGNVPLTKDLLIINASVGRITGSRRDVFNDSHWDFIDLNGFICQHC